jgi:hypothetical protein
MIEIAPWKTKSTQYLTIRANPEKSGDAKPRVLKTDGRVAEEKGPEWMPTFGIPMVGFYLYYCMTKKYSLDD